MKDEIGSKINCFEFAFEYSAILGCDSDDLINELGFELFFPLFAHQMVCMYIPISYKNQGEEGLKPIIAKNSCT